MDLEIYKISGTNFHFGRHGLGQEQTSIHFTSDSLFAAMVSRMVFLEGSSWVENFGAKFLEGSPHFVLSSAFPRIGDVLLFPPPMIKKVEGDTSSQKYSSAQPNLKDLKRVQYVSLDLFKKMINGATLVDLWSDAKPLQDDRVLVSQQEYETMPVGIQAGVEKIWKVTRRPRVTIGRVSQTSTIYHTGQVTYHRDCGLWFGVQWLSSEETIKEKVSSTLLELGDSGIGGERTSGLGAAEILSGGRVEFPEPKDGYWVNLSRYLPKKTEIKALQGEQTAYSLEDVGGWVFLTTWYKSTAQAVYSYGYGGIGNAGFW